MIRPAASPMVWPRLRRLTTSEPKSWTAPTKIDPSTTHSSAGSQPQKTAIAGPTIGPVPAMLVKWWPNTTPELVGTKSTSSRSEWAGVGRVGSSRKIRRDSQPPYKR